MTAATPERLPVVILISGSGSNLQAIMNAVQSGDLAVEIRAVISNRPHAHGLERARQAGIPTAVIDHTDYPGRAGFDAALLALIETYQPKLVVLAGFMRILTSAFVRHFRGRLINIHPSLLPAFTGLHTHQQAIEAGAREHGASIHFVTEELDGGPVIVQAKVPVMTEDDAETLARRVLEREHELYPLALAWFAAGRVCLAGDQVLLDGQVLTLPPQI